MEALRLSSTYILTSYILSRLIHTGLYSYAVTSPLFIMGSKLDLLIIGPRQTVTNLNHLPGPSDSTHLGTIIHTQNFYGTTVWGVRPKP
jgi:hypothetical protein